MTTVEKTDKIAEMLLSEDHNAYELAKLFLICCTLTDNLDSAISLAKHEQSEMLKSDEDYNNIDDELEAVVKNELVAEVLVVASDVLFSNPTLSVKQAIVIGKNEWDI